MYNNASCIAFIYLFIQQYWLHTYTYYISETVLGARDTVVKKVDSSYIHWKHILKEGWEIINEKNLNCYKWCNGNKIVMQQVIFMCVEWGEKLL